jgi:hypothetical protein
MNCDDEEENVDDHAPVCASDGSVHRSQCHMRKAACVEKKPKTIVSVTCPEGTILDFK